MFKFGKIAAIALSLSLSAALFTGCGNDEDSTAKNDSGSVVNFTPPKEGEDIIVMTIKDHGDIKIKLFPEQAEKGVENFKGLAEKGYYDGLTFHRVIDEFMIQGGDPLGNGTGGESLWGGKFDGGTSDKLTHVAGAVAYANSGATSTNGSQFYIVTGSVYDEKSIDAMAESYKMKMSDEVKKLYTTLGGTPWLDGGYTIFGQVFEGLDIVFDLQKAQTDQNDKPLEDIVIEKVSVEKYDGGDVRFYISDYK